MHYYIVNHLFPFRIIQLLNILQFVKKLKLLVVILYFNFEQSLNLLFQKGHQHYLILVWSNTILICTIPGSLNVVLHCDTQKRDGKSSSNPVYFSQKHYKMYYNQNDNYNNYKGKHMCSVQKSLTVQKTILICTPSMPPAIDVILNCLNKKQLTHIRINFRIRHE